MKEKESFSKIRFTSPSVSVFTVWALVFYCSVGSTNQLLSQSASDQSVQFEVDISTDDFHAGISRNNIKKSQGRTPSIFASLWRDDILNMTLKTDQEKLISEKKMKEYQSGTLIYKDNSGNPVTAEIQVKTRGNMRLNKCFYPPLKIKLSTSPEALRLVLGCEPSEQYQQALLREYIVYRLYNVISEHSFRVQLVNLHLEDTEGNDRSRDTYAMIIEDDEEAAARMGSKIHKHDVATTKDLDQQDYQIQSLFQYFVGNTDWQVTRQHNTRLITGGQNHGIIGLPYDFDHAGLVKAPYSVPNEKMPISSVQERFFIGDCGQDGYVEIAQLFIDKKEELLNVLISCAQLNGTSRNYAMKYLQRSFEILADHSKLENEIKRGCGWTQ